MYQPKAPAGGESAKHLLACFAEGRPGRWEAICLDFDIAVQGRSFEEVQESLKAAIVDYVESAEHETPEVKAKLLGRAAPTRIWLGYFLSFLWHSWRGRKRESDRIEHSFQMPCPA